MRVTTTAGTVRATDGEVFVFRASRTVHRPGRVPVPAAGTGRSVDRVRDATNYGPTCPQVDAIGGPRRDSNEMLVAGDDGCGRAAAFGAPRCWPDQSWSSRPFSAARRRSAHATP